MSDERTRFIAALLEGGEMARTCREHGISRKTGYKWWERYSEEGPSGLEDRSRAPHHQANSVSEEVLKAILQARRAHKTWGPKKLKRVLEERSPKLTLPALSTIGEVLKRHGLTVPRKRRRRVPAYCRPFIGAGEPNAVWTTDFKGHFLTGSRTRCHPLTLADSCSRYVLRCQGLTAETTEQVEPIFESAFDEFGLPSAILSDNGPPFAATGLTGLTRLSVWFIKLGIVPERIEPGHPEQNGRHERMHRTLKQETATPPKQTMSAQQRAFDAFVREYNHERPHEALGFQVPASVYRPSPRPMPRVVEPPQYDTSQYEVRKVSGPGLIAFDRRSLFVSHALVGEHVGLRYLGESRWVLRFAFLDLGIVDMRQVGPYIKMQPLPPELSWNARTRISATDPEELR